MTAQQTAKTRFAAPNTRIHRSYRGLQLFQAFSNPPRLACRAFRL